MLAVDGGRESILSVWQWQWGHLLGKVAVSNSLLNLIFGDGEYGKVPNFENRLDF